MYFLPFWVNQMNFLPTKKDIHPKVNNTIREWLHIHIHIHIILFLTIIFFVVCKYRNKTVFILKCLFSICKYNMGITYIHINRLYIQTQIYIYMFIHIHTYVYTEADILHLPVCWFYTFVTKAQSLLVKDRSWY